MNGELPFELVKIGVRGRTIYTGIEDLADNIRDNGLIQPIVLDNEYNLVAGGRRYHALKLLGATTLYHATTSDPLRPGYVLKGRDESTTLQNVLSEIAENLSRENLDWRDEMELIVKAYRLANAEANSRGELILKKDFGIILGCGYHDLKAALAVHVDIHENPKRYTYVTSLRGAYVELLKANAKEVERIAAKRSMSRPIIPRPRTIEEAEQNEPATEHTIRLSTSFFNGDGIQFLEDLPPKTVDHIITDPDYAIDPEILASNAGLVNIADGVNQLSVDQSLNDLQHFLKASYHTLRDQGFCIFFYDVSHHEKIYRMAIDVGFRVQRWPLIWKKTDSYSNAAPSHNFTKNIEYAMVCRKPKATLTSAQATSVFECGSLGVTKDLGHPFAKPYELWRWLYNAVTIRGQVVCDPFAGCGSACIAAIRCGLFPVGAEINPEHYHSLLSNLQKEYKRLLGAGTKFS
jgi:DNA modification methylase